MTDTTNSTKGKQPEVVLATLRAMAGEHGIELNPKGAAHFICSNDLWVRDAEGTLIAIVRINARDMGWRRDYDTTGSVTVKCPRYQPRSSADIRGWQRDPTNRWNWGSQSFSTYASVIKALVRARDEYPSERKLEAVDATNQWRDAQNALDYKRRNAPGCTQDRELLTALLDCARGELPDDLAVKAGRIAEWLEELKRDERKVQDLRLAMDNADARARQEA